MLVCSDYGFELTGDVCTAASWFDASVPVTTCQVGHTYRNSSGSVINICNLVIFNIRNLLIFNI